MTRPTLSLAHKRLACGMVQAALEDLAAGPGEPVACGTRQRRADARDQREAYATAVAWLMDSWKSEVWFEVAGLNREAVLDRLRGRGLIQKAA